MTPPWWKKVKRTKKPLDESERGEWKSWLKTQQSENYDHGIRFHHCMANRWENSGNSGWLYFLDSKITADGDCSHEIKTHLLLGRKVMTNLASILKSRDITYKGLSSQSYGFSSSHVWMWELDHKENWALKIDAFELWSWRRLLRDPWTARRSNRSLLKEIHPEYSLEGLMLKLKLQYFGHLTQKLIGKCPAAGKDWRQEEKQATEDEMVGWHHRFSGHELGQAPGEADW